MAFSSCTTIAKGPFPPVPRLRVRGRCRAGGDGGAARAVQMFTTTNASKTRQGKTLLPCVGEFNSFGTGGFRTMTLDVGPMRPRDMEKKPAGQGAHAR